MPDAFKATRFENTAALTVMRGLDHQDFLEAQIVRGGGADYLDLFSDWKSIQAGAVLSLVLRWHGTPFALLMLGNTGQAGVAQGALLARDHRRWRRGLARATREVRQRLPHFCAETGIHRIEARCWADHPSAAGFLTMCGFHHEADLPGFGPKGSETYQQFAWFHQKEF